MNKDKTAPRPAAKPHEGPAPQWVAWTIYLLSGLVIVVVAWSVWSQRSLQQQIADVKAEQSVIRQELDALTPGGRKPAAAAKRPVNPIISVAGARVTGAADAPLTLVEFSDYQ